MVPPLIFLEGDVRGLRHDMPQNRTRAPLGAWGARGESLVLHLCLLSFVLKAFVFCPSSFVLKGKRTKDRGQKTKDGTGREDKGQRTEDKGWDGTRGQRTEDRRQRM